MPEEIKKPDPVKQETNTKPGKKLWKPGQSGNPKGRPPNAECFTTLLRDELNKMAYARNQNGDEVKLKKTWREMVVEATLRLAIKGNATALKEIWDRIDGKQTQAIDLNATVRRIEDDLADIEVEESRLAQEESEAVH